MWSLIRRLRNNWHFGRGAHLGDSQCFDFDNPPDPTDEYASDVRSELGLEEDDFFILQPTRVVPRKGIEQAIKLVSLLRISVASW